MRVPRFLDTAYVSYCVTKYWAETKAIALSLRLQCSLKGCINAASIILRNIDFTHRAWPL